MATKSEEIAKLLNLSGADRTKINFLLEEYLAESANISDNSDESDGGDLDNDSPSSDQSSDESSENDLENMDDIGDFGNAMMRLTARGDIVSQDSHIEYQKASKFRYAIFFNVDLVSFHTRIFRTN